MKSFNDAEGAQDFIDDKIHTHLAKSYAIGFRHGAVAGFLIACILSLIK